MSEPFAWIKGVGKLEYPTFCSGCRNETKSKTYGHMAKCIDCGYTKGIVDGVKDG